MIKVMLLQEIKPYELSRYNNEEWIAQIKEDGVRAIADTRGGIQFYGRAGEKWLLRFPEIVKELKEHYPDCVFDGEIVCENEQGISDFGLIQKRSHKNKPFEISIVSKTIPATYTIFDALVINGTDITQKPLMERLQALRNAIKPSERVKVCEQAENLENLWKRCLKEDFEGIVLKRKDSPYLCGERVPFCIKVKNRKTTEIIFTAYEDNPAGITLNEPFRIACLGKQSREVKEHIDRTGQAKCEIAYQRVTTSGKYFQPTFVKLIDTAQQILEV